MLSSACAFPTPASLPSPQPILRHREETMPSVRGWWRARETHGEIGVSMQECCVLGLDKRQPAVSAEDPGDGMGFTEIAAKPQSRYLSISPSQGYPVTPTTTTTPSLRQEPHFPRGSWGYLVFEQLLQAIPHLNEHSRIVFRRIPRKE